jgi:FkbM family methyltransferase
MFWVDPVSWFGERLIEKGVYEPELSDVVGYLLRRGDIFLDIGANEGYFSILGSTLVKEEGGVYLVEPQTRLQSIIKQNLSINKCRNIQVVPLAFSDNDETVNLNLSLDVNSGSSSFHRRSLSMSKENVPCVTLDHFLSKNAINKIRLIKIDCEGAELLILSGAKEALKEHTADFISVDYHPQIVGIAVVKQIDHLLRSNGYLLAETVKGPWLYYLPSVSDDLKPLGPLKEIAPL